MFQNIPSSSYCRCLKSVLLNGWGGGLPSELESYHYEEILVLTHLKYSNKGMICKLTIFLPYPQATQQASTEHHELARRGEALQRRWMQRQWTSAQNPALLHLRSEPPGSCLLSLELRRILCSLL